MNATVQALYSIAPFRDAILAWSTPDPRAPNPSEINKKTIIHRIEGEEGDVDALEDLGGTDEEALILGEFQRVLAHLALSGQKFYKPERFSAALKLRNDVQQDAQEYGRGFSERNIASLRFPSSVQLIYQYIPFILGVCVIVMDRFLQLLISFIEESKDEETEQPHSHLPSASASSAIDLSKSSVGYSPSEIVSLLFEGRSTFLTKCTHCHTVGTSDSPFTHLALSIQV